MGANPLAVLWAASVAGTVGLALMGWAAAKGKLARAGTQVALSGLYALLIGAAVAQYVRGFGLGVRLAAVAAAGVAAMSFAGVWVFLHMAGRSRRTKGAF